MSDEETDVITSSDIAGALLATCKQEAPQDAISTFLIAEDGTLERGLVVVCLTDLAVEMLLHFLDGVKGPIE